MAENTELQEAKGLMTKLSSASKAVEKFLGLELSEEASKTEEKAELMEGSLEVGEYILPNGKKLIVTEEGAEIEAEPTEEKPEEEAEMTKEEDEEKAEMSNQEPKENKELVEMSAALNKSLEAIEALTEKVTNLEAAKPLTGAPKHAKKQVKQITPNMSYAEAAAIRLENKGL